MTDCTISLTAAGNLALHIPGAGDGHTVTIPATVGGLALLKQVLQARADDANRKIGECGSPTQWQMEQIIARWLKDNKPRTKEKVKEDKENAILDGVDLSELGDLEVIL